MSCVNVQQAQREQRYVTLAPRVPQLVVLEVEVEGPALELVSQVVYLELVPMVAEPCPEAFWSRESGLTFQHHFPGEVHEQAA